MDEIVVNSKHKGKTTSTGKCSVSNFSVFALNVKACKTGLPDLMPLCGVSKPCKRNGHI